MSDRRGPPGEASGPPGEASGPPGEASGPRSLSTVSASLVTTAERVVITKDGEAADQLVGCEGKRRGFDWDRLNDIRRRLGIKDAPAEEAEAMMAAFHDSALSRRVLGLEDEE